MRGRAGLVSTVGCLLALAPTIADAGSLAARVRWRPSATLGVVGYLVYQRAAGGSYGAALDVGLPVAAADGTLSAVIGGLTDGATYFFRMAAYEADGSESAPSNELSLAGGGGTAPAPDPCAAFAPEPLRIGSFVLWPVRPRVLAARGAFPVAGDLDPSVTGVTVEVLGPDGAVLYGETVPPSALSSNALHTRFRYARPRGITGPGLTQLGLRRVGDEARVRVAGGAPELAAAAQEPRLALVISVGDQCARTGSLVCTVTPTRTACE